MLYAINSSKRIQKISIQRMELITILGVLTTYAFRFQTHMTVVSNPKCLMQSMFRCVLDHIYNLAEGVHIYRNLRLSEQAWAYHRLGQVKKLETHQFTPPIQYFWIVF